MRGGFHLGYATQCHSTKPLPYTISAAAGDPGELELHWLSRVSIAID